MAFTFTFTVGAEETLYFRVAPATPRSPRVFNEVVEVEGGDGLPVKWVHLSAHLNLTDDKGSMLDSRFTSIVLGWM